MSRQLSGILLTMLLLLLSSTAFAAFRNQVLAVDLKQFDGREVLLVRSSHDMSVQTGYNRNADAGTISILLPAVDSGQFASYIGDHSLVTGFVLQDGPDGCELQVGLARPELTSQQFLRISQPSRKSLMLEVFNSDEDRSRLSPVVNPLDSLQPGELAEYVKPERRSTPSEPQLPAVEVSSLNIATFDLSGMDSQQVLSHAARSGLLNLKGRVVVETEDIGSLTVTPAGQSLANWMPAQPPGEIYLSGNKKEINEFLNGLEDGSIYSQAPLDEYWTENKPGRRSSSYRDGSSVDSRRRLKDDPHSGLYYDGFSPQDTQLSDIRVTLQAPGGMNLYDVINYLSEISGISIMIDPYAFDEPTGGVRDPKVPEPPSGADGTPGFRGADQFMPQNAARGGTFVGNLVNVPFDTALKLILGTHNLEFAVYGGGGRAGQSGSSMSSDGKARAYGDKPVILVTSPERLNQELAGTNEINMFQFHYADPEVVTDMLDSLGMLPGTDSGWFIYRGGGGGSFGNGGGGGGGGFGGGGGNGGGGGRGRVGSGGFAQRMSGDDELGGTASLRRSRGMLVYRGSSRQPVLQEVSEALEQGREVIRLILSPEQDGQLVTLFAN
ncbi:MAG: hypothetical protein H7A35_09815 [Planctomycetales bacterium]|nr:hypothetical protein [bacterium]UNM07172.1 MAG: hypothetical protein H7A35_09815 [Planctomycetales bacterium]